MDALPILVETADPEIHLVADHIVRLTTQPWWLDELKIYRYRLVAHMTDSSKHVIKIGTATDWATPKDARVRLGEYLTAAMKDPVRLATAGA